MANAEPFNTLTGYAVGIPPVPVIDANGNVINNVNAPNSNVTANRVFANAYFYANGQPLSIGASGSNTQVQFNNNGLLGASPAFTFNSASNLLTVTNLAASRKANLGNVGNVIILGGDNGYFLQTDGAGNLTWAPAGNGGNTGNGVPGGANTQVQFNDAGQFGGDAGFTYNKVSNTLNVANTISAGNAITGVNLSITDATIYNTLSVTDILASNITLSANITNANWINASYFAGNGYNLFGLVGANVTGQVAFANVANNVAGANVTGQVAFANVANNVAGANVTGQVANALIAGTVYSSAQPNITSVGNLTSLTVVGNTTLGNQVIANYFLGNLYGLANNARTVTSSAQPNITSVGTLISLNVTGNATAGNLVAYNNLTANTITGPLTTANQPNITSVGNLTSLQVNGNVVITNNLYANTGLIKSDALYGLITRSDQPNITSVGNLVSLTVTGPTNLGDVANVKILGGDNGYILSTDGAGNLSWVIAGNGGGGNGTPAGTNTQIQYNFLGGFGASANFTYNDTTKVLYVGGNVNSNQAINGRLLTSNIANGTPPLTVISTTPVANLGVETANTVRGNDQPNITSVGTLSNLAVSGTANVGNLVINNSFTTPNLTVLNNLNTTNFTANGVATFTNTQVIGINGVLVVNGKFDADNSSNVNLGGVETLHISGGTNGYALVTDGAGNLSWANVSGGGNGSPGGSNGQIQYNLNGNFGGSPSFTIDAANSNVRIAGNLISNTFTMGSGIYQFSRSNVFFATTVSTNPQVVLSIDAANVAAVDYTIISTDGIIRNFTKISAVINGSSLNYVEYSTLPVNGYVGDFQVAYNPGNVISAPSIDLSLTPQSANTMSHKMMLTVYNA